MMLVVAYDVSTESEDGKKQLRRVAKVCEDVGQRVQNLVFECLVDAAQWTKLRARLMAEAQLEEDSLRFYFLGDNWRHRARRHARLFLVMPALVVDVTKCAEPKVSRQKCERIALRAGVSLPPPSNLSIQIRSPSNI